MEAFCYPPEGPRATRCSWCAQYHRRCETVPVGAYAAAAELIDAAAQLNRFEDVSDKPEYAGAMQLLPGMRRRDTLTLVSEDYGTEDLILTNIGSVQSTPFKSGVHQQGHRRAQQHNHGDANPLRGRFDKLTGQEHDKVVKYLEASEATIKSIWDQLKIGNLQKEDHVSLIRLLRDEIDHILATRMPIVTAPMHPSNIVWVSSSSLHLTRAKGNLQNLRHI
ncbi:hypothetical protein FQN51_003739 [Onygenales sp. PD_10]|nr:hypothetical protein FQN51_003739 [Onygenales sp. PD_10]